MSDRAEPNGSAKIDAFLSAVEAALASCSVPELERQNVLEDLRAQIAEMLAARASSPGQQPTAADVEAVLSELDPPGSYAAGSNENDAVHERPNPMTQPKPQPARHGGGWWGKWRHRKEIAGAIRDAIRRHGAPLPIALSLPLTPRARRALELAKAEAQRKYHEYVGTEHLLTGLVTEGSGIAAIAMRDLGVKLEQVQEQTEQLVARGPSPVAAPLLTPRSRKAIETGDQLAHRLGHDFLGTEHLLLGLLADVDGVATQVLLNLRVSIDALQSRALSLMGKADVTIERLDGPVRACVNFWPSGTGKKVSLGGISWSFIATAAETGGAYAMFELWITSESTPPTLVLHRADLGIFVTTGEVAVDVGERAVSAAAGAFLHVPRGVKFSLRATTTAAAANAVVIASPAGFERFLAQVCDHPAAELDKLREIAKEHGIEVRNATAS